MATTTTTTTTQGTASYVAISARADRSSQRLPHNASSTPTTSLQPLARLFTAASGAFHAASGAIGMAPKPIGETVEEEWTQWRAEHPVRANAGAPPNRCIRVSGRPSKSTQLPWCSYATIKKKEWLFVPFLCERGGGSTQSLTGAPSEADLQQVVYQGQNFEHYSNIHRIKHLASGHPLVAEVEKLNKPKKGDHHDGIGRCVKGHQSPFDLKLTLAASGATMYVGFTVSAVQYCMASIWWRPGSGSQDVTERDAARAVFFDITEAEHQQVILGEKWRQCDTPLPTNEGQLADESDDSWEVSEYDNWEIGSTITCFEFQVPLAKPGTAWVQIGREGCYKLVAVTFRSSKEALIQPLAGSSTASSSRASSRSPTEASPISAAAPAAPMSNNAEGGVKRPAPTTKGERSSNISPPPRRLRRAKTY